MKNTQREVVVGILIALAAGIVVFGLVSGANRNPPATSSPNAMPLDATSAALLTNIPNATPITGAFGEQIRALETQIQACGDYPPERQETMQRYMGWLFAPNTIPPDLLILFSPNPTNRLLFAMAADTSTEWRRKQRPPNSCLIPIGQTLNDLLVAVGEEPINIYD